MHCFSIINTYIKCQLLIIYMLFAYALLRVFSGKKRWVAYFGIFIAIIYAMLFIYGIVAN